jgi:hypothetical protein
MILEDRGLIYDATDRPAPGRVAFFPNVCRSQSGTLFAAFQVGSDKHGPDSTVGLCRSDDAGRSWRELKPVFDTTLGGIPGSLGAPALAEMAPGRLAVVVTWFDRSDPARPLFDPVTQGILHSKLLLSVSSDRGDTWSTWRELATPGLSGCATTGPIVKWLDGTIAVAFESFKEFDDPRPGHHAAWIMVSRDAGRTFSGPVLTARHPEHALYYWDQRLCPTSEPGAFVALFWTHDLVNKRDRHVHLLKARIGDHAIKGEAIRETVLGGQIAAPLVLDDGRMLAFVVDRDRPGTLTLWESSDDGVTWPEGERLVVHTHEERAAVSQGRENIDFNQYWEDMGKWSFGHPVILPDPEHHALLAFYAGVPGCLSIHWARVRLDQRGGS